MVWCARTLHVHANKEGPIPYIRPDLRQNLRRVVPTDAGELNFMLTELVLSFLGKEPNYERFNAAVGALESSKLELYRRAIAPYEDKAKERNGDVFPGIPRAQSDS